MPAKKTAARAREASSEISVPEYVKRFSPEVQRIIQAARKTVRAIAPKARERAWKGWPIRYDVDGETGVAVMGQQTYVNVVFANGTELPDPRGLLEGTGKSLRHVKIHTVADASSPAVRQLVKAQFTMLATAGSKRERGKR